MNESDSDKSTNSSVQSFDGTVEFIVKFVDRRRHLRQLGGNPNNGKNDKIGMDGRNGTNVYRFLEPPSHYASFFASQSMAFLLLRAQTIPNVVHATEE